MYITLDVTVGTDSVGRRGMGHDDRTGFLSWEWFMVLDQFNPLKWIGLASIRYRFYRTRVIVRPVGSTKLRRPKAGCRPACLITKLEGSLSKGYNDHPVPPVDSLSELFRFFWFQWDRSFPRERERSPRTPLPPPAPIPAPGPVYLIPRTPMMDARRYRSLFFRRRVAPSTPPSPPPPPSDVEPFEGTVDPEAELEGHPEEPYLEGYAYPAGYDVYSSNASHGSEQESASAGSAPSSRHSSDDSSGSGSIGYGEDSSGSASDCASDDDLVNRHFAGTYP
ncbi:hypothetical protein PIB30_067751 [Stylosanthes scabra]|uniref:Uncharacterized protein n=1 Tax=Stylosanthes scabra TaxID=79078 RepID=A0ABU6QMM7_9FABA|nr:hypothetical protein [Stylosanthes scabra]